MENGSLVVQLGTAFAGALLSRTQGAEVFRSFGANVGVEFHSDASNLLVSNGNVEKDPWVVGIGGRFQNNLQPKQQQQ